MDRFCGQCGSLLEETTKRCPNCTPVQQGEPSQENKQLQKQPKKKKQALIWSLVSLVVIVGMVLGILAIAPWKKSQEYLETGIQKTFSNGDFVYRPNQEQIQLESQSLTPYFDNCLMVYLLSELTQQEERELAEQVEGTVVGKIGTGINLLQIYVEPTSYEQLDQKAIRLMEDERVLYAACDKPMEPTEDANLSDYNPWQQGDGVIADKGNEEVPEGNDWWAEAIGAYTAWEKAEIKTPVTVGILDSGFDSDHEDLTGKIRFLEEYEKNSEANHGTHVAGLIGGADNSVGIRGVADQSQMLCVDWSPATNDENATDYVSYLSTGEYIKIIVDMLQNGAKVINNSWGSAVLSKTAYAKNRGTDKLDENYENYLIGRKKPLSDSVDKAAFLVLLCASEYRDSFLVVQSAGNGYDNAGPGYEAYMSGGFRGITQEVFNALPAEKKELAEKKNITYQTIKDHLLIVAAAEDEKKDGAFVLTDFSNYGKTVDIAAPGKNIYSTICGNEYGKCDGTSMAAPIGSGSAALLWSCNPTWTSKQIKEALINSASQKAVGSNAEDPQEYPFINIGNALEYRFDEESGTSVDSQPGLTATDEDWKTFIDMYDTMTYGWGTAGLVGAGKTVDFATLPLTEVMNKYVVGDVGYGVYTYFGQFDQNEETGNWYWANFQASTENDYLDPLHRFFAFTRMDADTVDWVAKNVFGATPDRTVESAGYYYYGEKFYRAFEIGGGPGYYGKITKTEDLGNGRYGITVEEYCGIGATPQEDPKEAALYFVASLQQDEQYGRYWRYETVTVLE